MRDKRQDKREPDKGRQDKGLDRQGALLLAITALRSLRQRHLQAG